MMGYKHVDCRLPKNKKNNYEPNMIMIILENIPIWEKYVLYIVIVNLQLKGYRLIYIMVSLDTS